MAEMVFPARIMQRFVETLSLEIGHETFSAALSNAGLPEEWAHPAHFAALDNERTAQAYARLQSALHILWTRCARHLIADRRKTLGSFIERLHIWDQSTSRAHSRTSQIFTP